MTLDHEGITDQRRRAIANFKQELRWCRSLRSRIRCLRHEQVCETQIAADYETKLGLIQKLIYTSKYDAADVNGLAFLKERLATAQEQIKCTFERLENLAREADQIRSELAKHCLLVATADIEIAEADDARDYY